MQEGIKSYLASTAFTAFTASENTNSHCLIREHLKSHLFFNHRQDLETQLCPNPRQVSRSYPATIESSFFTNASNIPNLTSLSTKCFATGNSLRCRYCHCAGIEDYMSAARSLCKHTWKIMIYIVLTGKRRLRPDI